MNREGKSSRIFNLKISEKIGSYSVVWNWRHLRVCILRK